MPKPWSGLTEGLALVGVVGGEIESGACASRGAGAQLQATDVEDVEGDLVALADLAEDVLDGHLTLSK